MKLMKKLVFLLILITLAGCSSYKNVPYFKDMEVTGVATSQADQLYDARIMPKDLLSITVSSTDPETAAPYNQTVPTTFTVQNRSTYSQPMVQSYLVDNQGDIDFPVLGKLHLGGMTKSQAEAYIVDKLKSSFKETPIVTVRMINYKISVLGEVARPSTFTIVNEKVNIFEALALAGDMTVYGRRDNVKLLREDARGRKDIVTLDLNKSDIINSPYFYLQQNDVVYVEPNKAKAKSSGIGQDTSLWISATSILVSIASIVINIIK